MIFNIDKERATEKYQQNMFALKQIKIKNGQYESEVKEMRIEIGNIDDNEWSICKPNIINVEKNTEYQTFDISSIFDRNKQDFKVILISPYKSTRFDSKFIVHRLKLFGV